jgi:3alpha(or 20beta)-hydroxysteroid dehydrogenase
MGRLDGKVAIVTGGARGMGAATGRLFAREGAKVVITDLLAAEGETTAADIGPSALFLDHDVRVESDWATVIETTLKRHGRIDVLVNNAGIVHFSALDEMVKDDIDNVLATNVTGVLLGLKHVAPVMKGQRKGSIINISSVDGFRGANGLTAYTASKWAVRGLTKSAAYELGPHGIRVNSVHPGAINTIMGNPRGLPLEELNKGMGSCPLHRAGAPEEVAYVTLFLASDEASYVTASEYGAEAGWSQGYFQPALPGYVALEADARLRN